MSSADDLIIKNPGPVDPNDDPTNAPLYRARKKIHPKTIWGFFRKFKWWVLVALLAIYYIAPWLRWDRGPNAPDQAFLIDMPNRRAYFLWIEIWPQEIYYIAGILIVGALGLFFVTSLFGRVWCGVSCPQTVWTDLFMWVERRIEGDRGARIRLDKSKWTAEKVAKRTAKHSAWIVISLLTGGAWIMYFNDAPTLVSDIVSLDVTNNQLFFIGLFTATTYVLAGFAREQVCTYMCPWPRFQASMQDEDTMIVTYEAWRGEPRGKPPRDGNFEGRGDCIDCGQCVAVCPTGIDIRDGNQLECIGCGLCIDACNNVMDRVGLPRDLITYDSINRQNARAKGEPVKHRFFRPRTFVYMALLIAASGLFLYSLATRSHLDLNVIRDRNPLFVSLSDGSIRNGFDVKILNKTLGERQFVLEIVGLEGADMKVIGSDETGSAVTLSASPDTVESYRVFVTAPRRTLDGESTDFHFILTEYDDFGAHETTDYEAIFRGPER